LALLTSSHNKETDSLQKILEMLAGLEVITMAQVRITPMTSLCPTLQDDIPYCQSIGKKIILSLGGSSLGYQLTGASASIYFADFLWGAYGPLTEAWTAAGGIRPLDHGSSNTSTVTIDIDGFDFDIEHGSTGMYYCQR
jgi:hypothetical protein